MKYLSQTPRGTRQTIVFFASALFILLSSTAIGQTVQITQESFAEENHYSLTEPDNLGGDVLVAGTRHGLSVGDHARLKRVKPDGHLVWDNYMLADGMENRAMHIISSSWGNDLAEGTVFGFMDEGAPEALIYGLKDDGTILGPSKLIGSDNTTEETLFLHGLECSDGTWIAVGVWKSGTSGERSGLVVKLTGSGTIDWVKHIDSPIYTTGGVDYDGLNHVLQLPNGGFFLGGSGNLEAPNGHQQAAMAVVLNPNGNVNWGLTYVHSDIGYSSVAASAVLTGNGQLYQVVSGHGDGTFPENGFSLHEINLAVGGLVPGNSKNIHIPEHPIKAMSARSHPTNADKIILGGYMRIDHWDIFDNANGLPYGIQGGDHPPFMMEIKPSAAVGSMVNWHHIYDVPSTGFGASGDYFDVFTSFGAQPHIYHPEMMIKTTSGNDYTLIGYNDEEGVPGGGDHDLEFIATDIDGYTECDTYQAAIAEVESSRFIQDDIEVTSMEYQLLPFVPTLNSVMNDIVPCDACYPEINVTIDAIDCDEITITVSPIDWDAAEVCYDIQWGDGTTSSNSGTQTITHTWDPAFTSGTLIVSPYCCSMPSFVGIPFSSGVYLPSGCDCPDCSPSMRACQVDFSSPTTYYPSSITTGTGISSASLFSLFDCPSGCDTAPYDITVTLGNFLTIFNPFGLPNCLDDYSGEWYVDGSPVASFAVGGYSALNYSFMSNGTYEIRVVLTYDLDPACTEIIEAMVDVGDCVPPARPRMEIHDGGFVPCSGIKCDKSLSPLQGTCSSMTSEWLVDGAYAGPGDVSVSICLNWGWHDIELKYDCPTTGLTSSVEERVYCSPWVLGPAIDLDFVEMAANWMPTHFPLEISWENVSDNECGFDIATGFVDPEIVGTFNPFDLIGNPPCPEISQDCNNIEQQFSWNIIATFEDGTEGVIAEHKRFEGHEGEIFKVRDTLAPVISLKLELTGPDFFLDLAEPGTFSYEISVPECSGQSNSCPSDVTGDGLVTILDLLIVLGDFGDVCE